MSSIEKVLCLKAKNKGSKLFTTGAIYDVAFDSENKGDAAWVNDNLGRKTFIILCGPCIHGDWQPLEEYVCMTNLLTPMVKLGDRVFGYEDNGVIRVPGGIDSMVFRDISKFKKVSEMPLEPEPKPRHQVRHVIYDVKENKIANDAMGECYITLAEAQEVCDEMNEPKVMKPKYTREVEYFGMNVFVPDDAKWLSATESGEVIAHTCTIKPAVINSCGFYLGTGNYKDYYVFGGVDLNGIDWKDTLVEIKQL